MDESFDNWNIGVGAQGSEAYKKVITHEFLASTPNVLKWLGLTEGKWLKHFDNCET